MDPMAQWKSEAIVGLQQRPRARVDATLAAQHDRFATRPATAEAYMLRTDKLWKYDGSATGFYLAELVCPHSYYDDDHYCAIEFRCYLDDSDPNDPKAFSFTLHDDC